MVTMKDIAVKAGVSRTMVSYVLNNVKANHVSAENREKVLNTAKALGYTSNDLARAVRTGRDKVIGYVSYNLSNDPMIPLVAREIARTDYTISLFDFDENLIENCVKRKLSGLIWHSSSKQANTCFSSLRKANIKIAAIGTTHGDASIQISTDNNAGMLQGLNYLYELGHRNIVFAHINDCSMAMRARYGVYKNFMAAKKLKAQDVMINNYKIEESEQNFKELMNRRKNRPTAFFCYSSGIAAPIFYLASKHGIRIPDDISIVGFGQDSTREYLTHIDEQYEKMAEIIVPQLIDAIEANKDVRIKNLLSTKLVTAYTCGRINS